MARVAEKIRVVAIRKEFIIVDASDEPSYRRSRAIYAALRGIAVPIDLIVKTQAEVQKNATVVTSLTKKALAQCSSS